MLTPKQQKLVNLLMVNYGNKKGTKTLKELMILAGYSEQSAKNPKLILESEDVKDGIKGFIDSMSDKRKMALTYLTAKKFSKSPPREIAYVMDILTKNMQLLSGGKTSNEEITFKWK